MRNKRLPGQSQLDYLWSNYGIYSVSTKIESELSEYIPTLSLLLELLKEIKETSVGSISLADGYFIIYASSGRELSRIDISELSPLSISISDFGTKYVSQDDIDKGCPFPLLTKVIYISLSSGREFWAKQESLEGYSTSTIKTDVVDNYLLASLILDKDLGNVIISTENGLKADVKLFEEVVSLPIVGDPDKIYIVKIEEDSYSAFIYINGVAVSIGNIGEDSLLAKKVDNIEQTLTWKEL